MQREPKAVRELQAESGQLALEAELLRFWQSLGDIVAARPGAASARFQLLCGSSAAARLVSTTSLALMTLGCVLTVAMV